MDTNHVAQLLITYLVTMCMVKAQLYNQHYGIAHMVKIVGGAQTIITQG